MPLTCTTCADCGVEWVYENTRPQGAGTIPARCPECTAVRKKDQQAARVAQHTRDAKRWRVDNPEKMKAARRAWNEANRERRREHRRAHKRRNPEANRSYVRARKARKATLTVVPVSAAQLRQRLAHFGNRCWMCGSEDRIVLDHVKPLSKGGAHMLSNLRPACHDCNTRKGGAVAVPDVAVVVPWMAGCPHRERALEWVVGAHRERHPEWSVVVGELEHGTWSKARAVARALEKTDAEILMLSDADVWCDSVGESVEDVLAGAGWALPHRHVHRLDEPSTERFLAGERDGLRLERPAYWGKRGGGIVVLPRETYEDVPLDPRFEGWGFEDVAWGLALSTLVGKPVRRRAALWHMWHPPQPERAQLGTEASKHLGERYARAQHREGRMRSIIEEVRDGSSSDQDQSLRGTRPSAR